MSDGAGRGARAPARPFEADERGRREDRRELPQREGVGRQQHGGGHDEQIDRRLALARDGRAIVRLRMASPPGTTAP